MEGLTIPGFCLLPPCQANLTMLLRLGSVGVLRWVSALLAFANLQIQISSLNLNLEWRVSKVKLIELWICENTSDVPNVFFY